MNITDLQLGGGYTYQWECAILLALNYFFEPVSYEPTLFDLVTGFLGEVDQIGLERKDPDGADLEDITLFGGDRRLLIQVKTKQADWGRWTLTEPLLLKALRHFYDSPLLTPDSDDSRFVFLTNRPFNRDLVRIQRAIRAGTVGDCPEASRLLEYLQPEREEEEALDPERFHLMLSRTSLVQYLAVDTVKANVQAKLQAYGRRDWQAAHALLFEHFSRQSTRLGGGIVSRESIEGVLGSQAPGDTLAGRPELQRLHQALSQGRLLVLWGDLAFPLAERIAPDQRRRRLSSLPATFDPAGTDAEGLPALPPVTILSLDPGDRVERAFEAAGVRLQVVRTRRDVPARDRHSLLKLAGDLGTRSGVLLSRAQIGELRSDPGKQRLLEEARRAVEGGALLVVGCDPASDDFRAWWAALTAVYQGAEIYAVGDPSAPWPEGVACLGPDLEAVGAALRSADAGAGPEIAPTPPQIVTWLHLSDLHFRAATAYDEEVVLRALLQDLEEGLDPDFIVVSGDIAHSGQAREYDMARAFFDVLLRTTGLDRDRLFLVPGNHDVDRDLISRGARGIAASLTDRASANEVLGNDADRALMMARFEGYAAFVNDYLGAHLAFDDEKYYYVKSLDLAGQRIALLGLNSAWLAQGGDEDRSRLLIGERQTRAALDGAGDAGLKIALLHHPFDWLRDFDRGDSEAMLTDNVDFVLHGHLHQVSLLQARGPDSNAMIIAAGACYESRERPNAYNLVQLDLGRGQGTVHLRTYSDKRGGFWTKDVTNYRNVPDGVYHFTFPAVEGEPASPTPVAPRREQPPRLEMQGTPEPPQYNIAAVRDLLLAGFTAGELRRLMLYAASPALQQLTNVFSGGDGLDTMVEKTITHCRNKDCVADLLAEVEKENPRQYARFKPKLLP